jgi:methylglutaconyl-CoA hydratase
VTNDYKSAMTKAEDLFKEMMPNSPVAVRFAKQAIDLGIEVDLKTGLEIERLHYERICRMKDRIEGLSAFTEKRTPNYF